MADVEVVEMGNCSTIQHYSPDAIDLPIIQAIIAVLYSIVWVAAIAGIPLRPISVSRVSRSLGSSDESNSPADHGRRHHHQGLGLPSLLCKIIGVLQGGSIFVSSFTLTAIAIDRCFFIVKPNREIIGFSRAVPTVCVIWVWGYLLAFPVGLFSKTVSFDDLCGEFCEETWPDTDQNGFSSIRRLYGITVLLLQFGIPTVISSLCYWMISRVMSCQLEKRRGQKLLPDREGQLEKRKSRANRMMISMVGGLVLAWMPLNAMNLLRDFFQFGGEGWFSTVFALCHVVAMTSAVWNPLIYSWFNPQFRAAIKGIWDEQKRRQKFETTEILMHKSETRVQKQTVNSNSPKTTANLL
ncbi:unnamed protein product, partial [Mesorhabditis spiculigera]